MTRLEQENEQLTEALSLILLGEKLPFDIVNGQTGEIIIPAHRKITKVLLRKLAGANHDGFRLRCVSL
jgi:DNA-directed RNA polymerase subunit beta